MSANVPAVHTPQAEKSVSVWSSVSGFEAAQRMAKALIDSGLTPASYQGNIGGALVALDIAQRINASPLMVMQNLNIIEGRPAWGSSFIIAALNACGKFSPIRFKMADRGERDVSYTKWVGPKGDRRQETVKVKIHDKACVAYAIEKETGEILEGPEVSISMAVAEGWYSKAGSKWVTMPDLMLRYRAAAFFGRLYAPDLLMGFPAADEAADIVDAEYKVISPAEAGLAPAAPPAAEEPAPKGRAKSVNAAMKKAAEPAAPIVEDAKFVEVAKPAPDDNDSPPFGAGDDFPADDDEDGVPI